MRFALKICGAGELGTRGNRPLEPTSDIHREEMRFARIMSILSVRTPFLIKKRIPNIHCPRSSSRTHTELCCPADKSPSPLKASRANRFRSSSWQWPVARDALFIRRDVAGAQAIASGLMASVIWLADRGYLAIYSFARFKCFCYRERRLIEILCNPELITQSAGTARL